MEVWREVVLASIGEQFSPILEEGDDINGISLCMRYISLVNLLTPRQSEAIVQVWNRVADQNASNKIWTKIKALIGDVEPITHYYKRMVTVSWSSDPS